MIISIVNVSFLFFAYVFLMLSGSSITIPVGFVLGYLLGGVLKEIHEYADESF